MEKRAYTKRQVEEMGFNQKEYSVPKAEGTYAGKLVMKIYGHMSIFCYFITDEGEKIKACVWFQYDESKSYCPRKCGPDFSCVPTGTRWKVTFEKNSKGKLSWTDAWPI